MKAADIIETSQGQAVRLPDEFRFAGTAMSIGRAGEAVITEPPKPAAWPACIFENIGIVDPAFARPDPGAMPPAARLD